MASNSCIDLDFSFVDFFFRKYPEPEARKRSFDWVFETVEEGLTSCTDAALIIEYITAK